MRDEAQSERDRKTSLLNRRDYLAAAGVAGLTAVLGVGNASAQSDYDEALLVDATGGDASCTYTIDCSGDVERVETLAAVDDSIQDGRIEGSIEDGVAAYKLIGEVTAFAIDGSASIEYGSEIVSELPDPMHTIEIESEDAIEYEFTVTGEAQKLMDRGTMSAEERNDEIVHNDDGTCTVSGFTGNLGYGDAYAFKGEITDFSPYDTDVILRVDGEEVSLAELVGEPERAQTHEICITSPNAVDYEFVTTGVASKLTDRDTYSANGNDEIVHNDDGTCTVSGFTGNEGYGDSYEFEGEIAEFSPLRTDVTLEIDGEEMTPYELVGEEPQEETNEICITCPGAVDYEFVTTGVASKLTDRDTYSANDNDEIVHNDDGTCTVSGFTGNTGYGDSYEFEGEIADFTPLRTDVTLEINDEEMTPYELMGEEPPEQTTSGDTNIGGGEGYENTVSPSDATVTVSSLSGLRSALNNANSGDVVYVDGNATIDMGEARLTVPRGVTLASDRGIDGSDGALLETDDRPWGMFTVNRGARVTGIRIGGPRWDWIGNVGGEMGINVEGSNVEIDNCEVYGWGYAAVTAEDDTHVHHNHIHHNPKDGTGYGVSTGSSTNPIIEYNVFDHNRHSVASSSNGYTARYNYVGKGAISHVFDQHKPGGSTIKIHHNTVEVVDHATKNKNAPAVAIRGTPSDVADIHHNWFFNPKEPRSSPNGWTDEAIIQVHTNRWESVDYHNNHYGSDEPSSDVGHPR